MGLKPFLLHPPPGEGGPQSNQRGIETSYDIEHSKSSSPPQSNQRGIETEKHSKPTSTGLPCLNRTSVGLKQRARRWGNLSFRKPQSNQRGIETRAQGKEDNQTRSLNRTSVGLKRGGYGKKGGHDEKPQSNQRGIETAVRVRRTFHERFASIEPAWD